MTFTCDSCRVQFEAPVAQKLRRGYKHVYCSVKCSGPANGSRSRGRNCSPWPQRFWEKVTVGDGCWEWAGSRNRGGYGRVKVDGYTHYAPRVAWELKNGPVPDGLFVCHHCDNPPCVRPDHLFLGTAKDNTADMIAKGRARWPRRERERLAS